MSSPLQFTLNPRQILSQIACLDNVLLTPIDGRSRLVEKPTTPYNSGKFALDKSQYVVYTYWPDLKKRSQNRAHNDVTNT